jgi:hypothetical protein
VDASKSRWALWPAAVSIGAKKRPNAKRRPVRIALRSSHTFRDAGYLPTGTNDGKPLAPAGAAAGQVAIVTIKARIGVREQSRQGSQIDAGATACAPVLKEKWTLKGHIQALSRPHRRPLILLSADRRRCWSGPEQPPPAPWIGGTGSADIFPELRF